MQNKQYIYNTDFLAAIKRNKRNCFFLVLFLFIILGVLGYLLGAFFEYQTDSLASNRNVYYQKGSYYKDSFDPLMELSRMGLTAALIAICIGVVWTAIAIIAGGNIVLFSANARRVSMQDKDYPVLSNVVQEVSIAAGIQPPQTYIIETENLNAFATGMSPNKSAIAITRGLMQKLNRDELQGVIAHEIGHVINYDIRYQTLVSIIVGLIVLLSDIAMRMVFHSSMSGRHGSQEGRGKGGNSAAGIIGLILIVFSIVAPIAAVMLQMAVSRQREYMADATSVKLTRNPLGLISALGKLGANAQPFPGASKANQNLFIVNPFRNVAKLKSSLLATHPPLDDRIKRLQNLGKL